MFIYCVTNRNSRREMVWCEENQRNKRTEEPTRRLGEIRGPYHLTNCSFAVFLLHFNNVCFFVSNVLVFFV